MSPYLCLYSNAQLCAKAKQKRSMPLLCLITCASMIKGYIMGSRGCKRAQCTVQDCAQSATEIVNVCVCVCVSCMPEKSFEYSPCKMPIESRMSEVCVSYEAQYSRQLEKHTFSSSSPGVKLKLMSTALSKSSAILGRWAASL